MPEDLYSGGAIRLFGRVYSGLVLGTNKEPATPGSGLNLASQLDPKTQPQLARIYGFSYAGNYFKLADPGVLLVPGPGVPLAAGSGGVPLEQLGVEFKDETFADTVLMWEQDE